MSRGTEYLAFVTEKLENRLEQLEEAISDVQKDIDEMNTYYWENYTEMDQYGYENFDNQQALKQQVNANQENRKMKHRLKKMLEDPYFGSVDFVYEDEEEEERFYIGIGNFAERAGSIPLTYDWRAPVSGLFYDYDKGEASYEAPGGTMAGEILSKWQYKIRRGKMIYEFESEMKIDDDILKQELGAAGDIQLKNIVRTIQKEQNAIIRNTKDRILVIQGAAGSGKTSVALHRIAYLLYHDRKTLKSSNILILSPNSVFSDYISHILPELGEENIREMSLDLFAYRELKGVASDCEDRYDYLEKMMMFENAEARERYQFKQSKDFIGVMEGFLVELEDRVIDFRDVKFHGMEMKAEEIMHLFYFKFLDIPLLSRMEAVMEYFIDSYETLYDRHLSEEKQEEIQHKFMRMYVTRDLYKIYNWLLEDYGYPVLPDVPLEKRKLEYEDVYPILYLKYRLCNVTDHREIKHLVIDEMQDYSYLVYIILSKMFSCRMTILGDRAQTMDEKPQDVLTFLPKILGKEIRRIEMKKSYRNTTQVAEYAMKISGDTDIELLQRHGKEVAEETCLSMEEALQKAVGELRLGEEDYETAAILTMTEKEAILVAEWLKEQKIEASYIDRDSSTFKKGITVTTFYLAKGLEFDQVFIVGGNPENGVFKQFRYICATRALHELYVYDIEHR